MVGGDLLNLLMENDTFDEEMTRFYVAEMVLALEEIHKLGYVHHSIKPDNFLFDKEGISRLVILGFLQIYIGHTIRGITSRSALRY